MSQQLASATRKAGWALALVALAAGGARAQPAPSTQDGPLNPGSANAVPADAMAQARPFSDGSYPMGPGITAPKIVQAVPAVYPPDVPANGFQAACLLSMVIGKDGVPADVHPTRCAGDAMGSAAMDAVKHSSFEPGSLNQQPVPVRIHVRVLFTSDHTPAVPFIYVWGFAARNNSPRTNPAFDGPPQCVHTVFAEYSEEARRQKISGTVKVSALVTEEGLPTDVRVERSLGYGLDEKAIESVTESQFKPAIKDGKPVAARITVVVNFQLR